VAQALTGRIVNRRNLAAGLVLLLAGGLVVFALGSRVAEPLSAARGWIDARNAGEVAAALGYVAESADILGIDAGTSDGRDRLRALLEAQFIAGWRIEDSECTTIGERVVCRYTQADALLRKCGRALTGEHRYDVSAGKLIRVARTHDLATREPAYAAIRAFRAWVERAHPVAEQVIWSDPNAISYATPEGARAMLAILDEYDC
jgi:hypothetical protein